MNNLIYSTREDNTKRTVVFILSTVVIFVVCVLAMAISNVFLESGAKTPSARESMENFCLYLNIFIGAYGVFKFVKALYKYLTYIEIHTDKVCGKSCKGLILQDFSYTYGQVNDVKITKYGTLTIFTQTDSQKVFGNGKDLERAVGCYNNLIGRM